MGFTFVKTLQAVLLMTFLETSLGFGEDNSNNTKTLYVGAFYPLTKAFSSWGQGCLPAAELAVRHINQRGDILPGYRLQLINMDTQVRLLLLTPRHSVIA